MIVTELNKRRRIPSRIFWVTVNVLPVSSGTVQLTESGERTTICSGDFTRVGSARALISGSSSSCGSTMMQPLASVAWFSLAAASSLLPARSVTLSLLFLFLFSWLLLLAFLFSVSTTTNLKWYSHGDDRLRARITSRGHWAVIAVLLPSQSTAAATIFRSAINTYM